MKKVTVGDSRDRQDKERQRFNNWRPRVQGSELRQAANWSKWELEMMATRVAASYDHDVGNTPEIIH